MLLGVPGGTDYVNQAKAVEILDVAAEPSAESMDSNGLPSFELCMTPQTLIAAISRLCEVDPAVIGAGHMLSALGAASGHRVGVDGQGLTVAQRRVE